MLHELLLYGEARVALVLAVGLAAYALLSRAAAATRRFVLLLTLSAALVVPAAAAVAPRWTVSTPPAWRVLTRESPREGAPVARRAGPAPAAATASGTRAAAEPSSPRLGAADVIVLAWLLVAAALLVRVAASQLRARALVRRARPIEGAAWSEARVPVKASAEVDSPAVMGLVHPTIVVPEGAADWPAERCRVVLVHEMAHVRRRDVMAQAMADVACALHWCDPLVWVAARRLRVERELAADDAVLAVGVRPSRYAEELLAVAVGRGTPAPRAALAMAERSSLETRVTSILATRRARAPLAAGGTAAVVAAGLAIAAAAACLSPGSSTEASSEPSVEATVADPSRPPVPPSSGSATDPVIQRAAQDEIVAIRSQWAPRRAVILVLDPSTGEVLANAGESGGRPADVGARAPISPGSTIKPLVIAAALQEHAITPDQRFECGPAPRRYGDRELHDARENGTLDVPHLLAVSSNVGMSRIFDALGGEALGDWLRRFHFDDVPPVPGATRGAIPDRLVTGTMEGATAAIGHRIVVTPLQMIAAYGAIAADGVYHAPTLDRGGSRGERLLSPETAQAVMEMLETVVADETGTGHAARVDGVRVAGKTGTADGLGPGGQGTTYASFVGVADLPARRLVALVGIEAASRDGLTGGAAAAPVFARLVTRLR